MRAELYYAARIEERIRVSSLCLGCVRQTMVPHPGAWIIAATTGSASLRSLDIRDMGDSVVLFTYYRPLKIAKQAM